MNLVSMAISGYVNLHVVEIATKVMVSAHTGRDALVRRLISMELFNTNGLAMSVGNQHRHVNMTRYVELKVKNVLIHSVSASAQTLVQAVSFGLANVRKVRVSIVLSYEFMCSM